MRPLVLAAVIGLSMLAAALAARAQAPLPDPPICNSSLREWGGLAASSDYQAMERLLARTLPACRQLRAQIQARVTALRPASAADACAAAEARWTEGLRTSTDRTALQRFINDTPARCSIVRDAAQQRLTALPAPPRPVEATRTEPRQRVGHEGAPVRSANGLLPGEAFRECSGCPEMIIVPGGVFLIGSPDTEAERTDNEGPQRRISIRQFAVGRFEVTFDEWAACVSGGGCNGYQPSDDGMGRGRRPVIRVSWHDARAYVSWLSGVTGQNYRLLSEAEWEYSARARSVTAYSWGDVASHQRANYMADANGGDPWPNTAPVGSFDLNAFGLFDMHGNVWEWIQDCATAPYAAIAADGAPYENSCGDRGLRGGAWDNSTRHIRAAQRYGFAPTTQIGTLGFRVARTLN